MPDYRNNEIRINAAKAVRATIKQATKEKPATAPQLRLMVAENYGFSSKWVNEYVKNLVENEEAEIDRTTYEDYYTVWGKHQ